MDTNPGTTHLPMICWICGRSLQPEECKLDEHGLSVHGDCYAATVSSAQQAIPDRMVKEMVIVDNVVRSLVTVIRKLAAGRASNRRRDLVPTE